MDLDLNFDKLVIDKKKYEKFKKEIRLYLIIN